MSIDPGAGLKFEHLLFSVERPDSSKGCSEMTNYCLGAMLQDLLQIAALGQAGNHIRAQSFLLGLHSLNILDPLAPLIERADEYSHKYEHTHTRDIVPHM